MIRRQQENSEEEERRDRYDRKRPPPSGEEIRGIFPSEGRAEGKPGTWQEDASGNGDYLPELMGEEEETIDRRRVSAFHHRKRRHADGEKNIRYVSRVPGKDEHSEAGAKYRTGQG
jgi:hypothetical protein